MYQWSALSGVYEGSDFTLYEEEAWKCFLELHWEDTGRVLGSGYLTPGEDFLNEENANDSFEVVFFGQITERGNLYGMMVAPQRFNEGVCWSLDLAVDVEKRELEGGVSYSGDSIDAGEPGSLFLKYQRGF